MANNYIKSIKNTASKLAKTNFRKPAKLSAEAEKIYRTKSALQGWETRRLNATIKRIADIFKQRYNISTMETKKILAQSFHRPNLKNSWNTNTKPHPNNQINKNNLENYDASKKFLANEATLKKPHSPDYYIKKAFQASVREGSEFALKELNKIDINTKQGLKEYAQLIANDTLEQLNEEYEELRQASKEYQKLSEKEKQKINWQQDVYNSVTNNQSRVAITNEDGSIDWEKTFANQVLMNSVE